jgi:hypothetical protein
MPVSVNDLKQFKKLVKHTRYREYMSGIAREHQRIKTTGEVFTPTKLVQEMLNELPDHVFTEPDKKFLDPTCGDGQFLSEVLIRKVKSLLRQGKRFSTARKQALDTIYGVDLMKDNCIETIKRLHKVSAKQIQCEDIDKMPDIYRRTHGIRYIFKLKKNPDKILNIVCADGLKYDFSFGRPPVPKQPKTPKPKKSKHNIHPNAAGIISFD